MYGDILRTIGSLALMTTLLSGLYSEVSLYCICNTLILLNAIFQCFICFVHNRTIASLILSSQIITRDINNHTSVLHQLRQNATLNFKLTKVRIMHE